VAPAAGIPELASFAAGLRRDWAAVQEALTSPWSNGQTEGQASRLEMLKRQMYGRATFDLLRKRVLVRPGFLHQMCAKTCNVGENGG